VTHATYWEWVRSEAALIDSDGCTGVSGLFLECCWEHDVAFFHGKDPRAAYRLFNDLPELSRVNLWLHAPDISFEDANARFKKCHIQRTKWGWLGWINPMTWIRWRGVVRLSRGAWEAHRQREREARPLP